jgi:hypothetical protein
MHVEDEWHAAGVAIAAIGKADAVGLDILSGRGLVGSRSISGYLNV